MWFPQFLVLCLLHIHSSHAYSMGAPDQACNRMTPGHGFDPQNNDDTDPANAPVQLILDPPEGSAIAPGQTVSLTLSVTGPTKYFKGFIIQARNGDDKDTQIGSFSFIGEEVSHMTCGKGIHNSITHRSPNDKAEIKAEWKAPDNFEGTVFFKYSLVLEYDQYYTNYELKPMRVTRSATEETIPEGNDKLAGSTVIFPDDPSLEERQDSVDFTEETEPPQSSTTAKSTTTTQTTTTTRKSTTTTTPAAPTGVALEHPIFEGCGDSKACFGIPKGCLTSGNCKAIVSYELSGDEMLFKMTGRSDGYLAVGLSPDNDKMGDDLTTACYYDENSGQVGVQTGYNVGYSNTPLRPPMFAINHFSGSFDDGFINCEFKRPSEFVIDDNKVPANTNTFSLLKDKYVILLAEGSFRSGRMLKHRVKDATSEPLPLGVAANLQGKSNLYLRLHGAFMLGAWIGSASLGILIARYFKSTWTGAQCCKKDMWFVAHRTLMVLTWCLNMAGFLLIFAELGWQWTAVPINENPHAVLGCVTTGLCFIQPFMAMLRPHPGTSRRPIFNWIHWFVGNSAQIVGIVAIFFAVDLDKAELPKETDYLLIAFVAFHALIHLIMSCVMCRSETRAKYATQPKNGYAMRQMGGHRSNPYPEYEELKRDSPGAGLRKFFLAVYIIVGSLVTAALIALVVLAPTRAALYEAGILPEKPVQFN